MEAYLSKYGLVVLQRKPWQSHAGGLIFELAVCPLNSAHTHGSAAFTLADGVPGFTCKHNGCHGKTMRDILAIYPAEQPEGVHEQVDREVPKSDDDPKRARTQAEQLVQLAMSNFSTRQREIHSPKFQSAITPRYGRFVAEASAGGSSDSFTEHFANRLETKDSRMQLGYSRRRHTSTRLKAPYMCESLNITTGSTLIWGMTSVMPLKSAQRAGAYSAIHRCDFAGLGA